tara:strand:- start:2135 stop:2620 length:486 start_codon:yes stop_codon:yes gene_type:complete
MGLSLKGYLLLNGFLLFFISLNNVFNIDLIDLTLILSVILYSMKWNKSEWLVPLFLFVWGIFQDILLGMNMGYSGSIFLFFYFLSQIISNYGVFEQQYLKFIILLTVLCIFFVFKNIFIYLNYQLNYLSVGEFLSFCIVVLLYFPLNFIILNNQKKYEEIR